MKRLHLCLSAIFLLVATCSFAVDIFVSPSGSDNNSGTKEQPLATLSMALRKARDLRRVNDPSVANGIHIILRGGVYPLHEPVFIRPEDSGTPDSPTYIEAAAGEQPILSGGIQIGGWKKITGGIAGLPAAAKANVWVADVPLIAGRLFEFRQLWIDDSKAVRAKSANGESMHRILDWNKREQTCWIPTPKVPLQNIHGMEMFIHQWWAIAILRIKKMEVRGDSTKLFFHQPESRVQSEHPWPAPWLSKETGNSAFYLTNAIQFLDEPGEWYLDATNRKLYYWPRNNEDMARVTAIAPYLETLVAIKGTPEQPVSHVYFNGISFRHTGWLRPSQQGHVPHQAGMYMLDAYSLKPAGTADKPGLDNQAWTGRPAAAAEVRFSNNIHFTQCTFIHTASTALDLGKGNVNAQISGNLFKDIGGTGILAGHFSDEGWEIHKPYLPAGQSAGDITSHIRISNNLITNATNEDWSCLGIAAGYIANSEISHNEVENVSYSGISLGWGWSPAPNALKNNRIHANHIHHYGKHNYDCAGIYTLSNQGGSMVDENYIDSIYKAPYVHLPSHWFYVYTDEGSSYITVKDNWTPAEKFLQNANGTESRWLNNGPMVHESIRQKAGLQPAWQWMRKERTAHLQSLPINEEHNEVIELVVQKDKTLDVARLRQVLAQNKMDSNAIYQWQNHYVIYSKVQDVAVMQGRLQGSFPEAEVKVYHDMFYQYSRKKHCADKSIAKEWDHVLLTTNLADDVKLQREYLDYHSSQFEKWPEVAKGFCNADFQQLLLFRNGRQLVLIISIPKGESLDKLNPRTTANNPRMDQWNKIMSKYQEGIKGTKKGEIWVFLKQVNN